jgi:hypothetical protein
MMVDFQPKRNLSKGSLLHEYKFPYKNQRIQSTNGDLKSSVVAHSLKRDSGKLENLIGSRIEIKGAFLQQFQHYNSSFYEHLKDVSEVHDK